ncbi:hypothetical protein D9615_005395 [Tricholomella constricta]|uniref:CCHC-type domain-containing protein n=1 Tax=Tricholomella constricta TaxID=117010 RepID=A0A8H5HEB2_9AGAR|nr:hypothetical protein D9615_005395 [Tricholomella constricta]
MADPFAPTGAPPPPSRAHSMRSHQSILAPPPSRVHSTPAQNSVARTSSRLSSSSVPCPLPLRTPAAVIPFPEAGITWSHTLPRALSVGSRPLAPVPLRKPYDTVTNILHGPTASVSSYHPPPSPSPVPHDRSPAYMHSSRDLVPVSHQSPTVPVSSSSRFHSSSLPFHHTSIPSPSGPSSQPHLRSVPSHVHRNSPHSTSHPSPLRHSFSPPPPLHIRLNTPIAPQPRYPIDVLALVSSQSIPRSSPLPLFYPSPAISTVASPIVPSSRLVSSPARSLHSVNTVLPVPTYTFTETKLPSTLHIPILNRADDWLDWYTGVQSTIEHSGLWAFVAPDPLPGAYSDPASIPTFPPFVDFAVHHVGSPELDAYQAWWRLDDVVSYIVTSRLGNVPRRLLPMDKRDVFGHRVSSSRTLLLILREKYGVGHAAAAELIKTVTLSRKANSVGGIVSYVTAWQQAVMQTQSTRWPFSYYEQVQKFLDGLPFISAFDNLRASVRLDVERLEADRVLSFNYLASEVLKIEMDLRRLAVTHPQTARRPLPTASLVTTSTPPVPSGSSTATSSSSSNPPDRPVCDNCGSLGHLAPNCWRPGGGDEGGKERYLTQKAASRFRGRGPNRFD